MSKRSGGMNTDRLKLELRRASIPFLMLVVLIIAGFANAANIVRNLSGAKFWQDYTEYRVAFANPEGVIPSRHELRIAGVKSGYISDAKLKTVGGRRRGVLTLAVDKKDAPLYKDARVVIRPVTPLEDMYVDITSRGSKQAGELDSGKSGDILPVERTRSMIEIGRVLNVLDEDTRPRLTSLINELSRGMEDNGKSLREAFTAIGPFLKTAQRMSEVLDKRSENLKRFVHNLGDTTEILGDRDRELNSFIRSGRDTVQELAQNDGPLAATISSLPPTLNSLRSAFAALQSTEDRLDAGLRSVLPVAKELPEGLDALQDFSKEARPAVTALRPAVRSLRPLARDLRPTARSLSAMFPQVSEQAPQLDEFVGFLANDKCQKYVGNLVNWVPSFSKFNDSGPFGPAHARADAFVTFTAFGEQARDPTWFIAPPCYSGNDALKTGGPNPLAPPNAPKGPR